MSLKNLSVRTKIPKLLKNKLKNKKINQIYSRFEKSLNIKKSFIVGVSGGPDSLALAFLAKVYSLKKNIKCKFYIVDHKLRSNSTIEAKNVQKILKKCLINSEILSWKGQKPNKNVQSLARKKRLELLSSKCDQFKIGNILLGHHQDDLIENFFIRILRGSGLKGLVSLDKKSVIEKKNLIRPLLFEKKENLIFISKHVFNFYVQDPSNKDEKYLRIRIRKLIEVLKKNGLNKKQFIKTIKNLKSSNSVVDYYVSENLSYNTFFYSKKNITILNREFFQKPYEITFRSFSYLIKLIGKKHYFVRGKKLDNVITNISKNNLKKLTLGGCIIEKVNQTIIVSKER